MPDISPLDFWTRLGAAALISVFMWRFIGLFQDWLKSQQASYAKRDEASEKRDTANIDILKHIVDVQESSIQIQRETAAMAKETALVAKELGVGLAAALLKLDEHAATYAKESSARDAGLTGDIAKVQTTGDTILVEVRDTAVKILGIVQTLSNQDATTAAGKTEAANATLLAKIDANSSALARNAADTAAIQARNAAHDAAPIVADSALDAATAIKDAAESVKAAVNVIIPPKPEDKA